MNSTDNRANEPLLDGQYKAAPTASAALDAHFRALIASGVTPNVSAAFARGQERIYGFTEGASDDSASPRVRITGETRFNIGSVTKPVTAALVVKLLEQGRITLEDSVRALTGREVDERITVRQLLTHSAGYADFPEIPWPQAERYEAYMNEIYALSPKLEPGSEAGYFTYGYSMLMDIIERVSGQSLEQFAREQLFDPLGMDATTYEMARLAKDEYVIPLHMTEMVEEPRFDNLVPTGDSGLHTTADDLLKFGMILLGGGVGVSGQRVFAAATVRFMLREFTGKRWNKTPIFWAKGNPDSYRYFGDLCSPSVVGHPGFSGCMLFVDPENDAACVVLTNSQRVHGDYSLYRRMSSLFMTLLDE